MAVIDCQKIAGVGPSGPEHSEQREPNPFAAADSSSDVPLGFPVFQLAKLLTIFAIADSTNLWNAARTAASLRCDSPK